MIKGLKLPEIKSHFKKMLDDKRHWCVITKQTSAKGCDFIRRIGTDHYCFDQDKFTVFPVRHATQQIVLVGWPEKSRVSSADMCKYLGQPPVTVEELENSSDYGVVILSDSEDEGARLIGWMMSIVGDKYFA